MDIKSIAKHGEHVESLKYKKKGDMTKLKVKFDKSPAREVAMKKMKAHVH